MPDQKQETESREKDGEGEKEGRTKEGHRCKIRLEGSTIKGPWSLTASSTTRRGKTWVAAAKNEGVYLYWEPSRSGRGGRGARFKRGKEVKGRNRKKTKERIDLTNAKKVKKEEGWGDSCSVFQPKNRSFEALEVPRERSGKA